MSASVARADDAFGGSFGLSLAPPVGEHVEAGSVAHPPPVPLPIGQVSLRDGRFGIFFESLPASPAIDQQTSDEETLATHLAFFDTVARVYDRSNRFWIGAGEIGYNQSTTYLPYRFARFEAMSSSRVVGGRYELGAGLARKPEKIRLWVDFMPALHGVNDQNARYRHSLALPENGSQFETQLAVANAHGPFEFD